MLERQLAISDVYVCPSVCLSVCLSVCPSHAGIDSKLETVGSCGFHLQVAQGLWFFGTKHHWQKKSQRPWTTLNER